MGTILFAVTAISSLLGAATLAVTILGGASAPQQAAGAGIAIALAVIPYVFCRLYQLSQLADVEEGRHAAILRALAGVKTEDK